MGFCSLFAQALNLLTPNTELDDNDGEALDAQKDEELEDGDADDAFSDNDDEAFASQSEDEAPKRAYFFEDDIEY